MSQSLTLNLGLRWETDTPMKDADRRMNGFDPVAINPVSGTPGVVRFAGRDGWPAAPYKTDWNNFGPRIGFAWKSFAHTVVRGGMGIFFAHPFDHGAPNSAALGFEKSASLNTPDNGITAPFFLRDGVLPTSLGGATLDASFGAVRVGQPATTAVTFFERNRRTGYSQQFTLSLQHELSGGWRIELSGLGNLSRKLPSPNLSINQIEPSRLTAQSTQRDRPFPQFAGVTLVFPTLGISNYYAGVLRVEKRFAAGFSFYSTYTWSKFMNNTDEGGTNIGDTGVYADYYNRRLDYGPSANDVRHRFTISSVYEVPFGAGKRYRIKHPLRHLVGNWTLSVLGLLQSGSPYTVTVQTNTTNAFAAGALRADLTGSPDLDAGERKLTRWFNTGAFAQPAPLKFGTSGRGVLYGDGIINFDISALKSFVFGEGKYMQFRVEMFNTFNHPDFGLPGHTFGAPGFGVVLSARGAHDTVGAAAGVLIGGLCNREWIRVGTARLESFLPGRA